VITVRQRITRLTPSYDTISWLLFAATIMVWLLAIYLVADWRHDLMVKRDCEVSYFDSYSQSKFCLDTKGLAGWVASVFEAFPIASLAVLVILGVVSAIFRKQLDLADRYSERRDGLFCIGGMIAVLSALVLCSAGILAMYIH
jgi:hypothetical protein